MWDLPRSGCLGLSCLWGQSVCHVIPNVLNRMLFQPKPVSANGCRLISLGPTHWIRISYGFASAVQFGHESQKLRYTAEGFDSNVVTLVFLVVLNFVLWCCFEGKYILTKLSEFWEVLKKQVLMFLVLLSQNWYLYLLALCFPLPSPHTFFFFLFSKPSWLLFFIPFNLTSFSPSFLPFPFAN